MCYNPAMEGLNSLLSVIFAIICRKICYYVIEYGYYRREEVLWEQKRKSKEKNVL